MKRIESKKVILLNRIGMKRDNMFYVMLVGIDF